jgi:hypothetical protein
MNNFQNFLDVQDQNVIQLIYLFLIVIYQYRFHLLVVLEYYLNIAILMKDFQMNHVQLDIEMKHVEDVGHQD